MEYVGTVAREWWNGWFLNGVNELSTKVVWGVIGEWHGEWVRSESFEKGMIIETRFSG